MVGVEVFEAGDVEVRVDVNVGVWVGVDVLAEERVAVWVRVSVPEGVFVRVCDGALVNVAGCCVDVVDVLEGRTTDVKVGKFVTLGVEVAPGRGVTV